MISSLFFFLHQLFLQVAREAAAEQTATPLDPPTQIAFSSDEVPSCSNQVSRYNQTILAVVVRLASSHLL